MIVDIGIVAECVELEEAQRVGRRVGNSLQARVANRTRHVGDPKFPRSANDAGTAGWIKIVDPADWGEHDGKPKTASECIGTDIHAQTKEHTPGLIARSDKEDDESVFGVFARRGRDSDRMLDDTALDEHRVEVDRLRAELFIQLRVLPTEVMSSQDGGKP